MVASQTRAASVVAGDVDWVVDLCDHSHGFTVSDVLNETNEPASNRVWVQRALTEYSRSISVPVVFYGDATDALSPRTSGFAFAILGALGDQQAFIGGAATWVSVPRVAPQSGIVSGGVEFMQRQAWVTGVVAQPFMFTAGDTSVPVATAFANTSAAWIAVTNKTVTGNRVVTVSDGTDDVTVTFPTSGVRSVDLSTLTNNIDGGAVSVASLTGDQTIEGWFLAGSTYSIPSGVLL